MSFSFSSPIRRQYYSPSQESGSVGNGAGGQLLFPATSPPAGPPEFGAGGGGVGGECFSSSGKRRFSETSSNNNNNNSSGSAWMGYNNPGFSSGSPRKRRSEAVLKSHVHAETMRKLWSGQKRLASLSKSNGNSNSSSPMDDSKMSSPSEPDSDVMMGTSPPNSINKQPRYWRTQHYYTNNNEGETLSCQWCERQGYDPLWGSTTSPPPPSPHRHNDKNKENDNKPVLVPGRWKSESSCELSQCFNCQGMFCQFCCIVKLVTTDHFEGEAVACLDCARFG